MGLSAWHGEALAEIEANLSPPCPGGLKFRTFLPISCPRSKKAAPRYQRQRRAMERGRTGKVIIQPISLAAQLWAGANVGAVAGASADSWRVGALLAARVLGQNDVGKVVLQVGGLMVEVEAEATGAQLPSQFQVRVLSNGVQPQLEMVADVPADRLLVQALRERLPQQNGYAPLLGALSALARRPEARSLPVPLRTALATLESATTTPEEVSSSPTLKDAIARSGLFLESRLATPDPAAEDAPVGDDWKAALMRLARVLEGLPALPSRIAAPAGEEVLLPARDDAPENEAPVPPRQGLPATRGAPLQMSETAPPLRQRSLLAQQRETDIPADTDIEDLVDHMRDSVRGALARVEVAQLESQPQNGVWMIELPLRGERGYDILQLRIEQEPTQADGMPGPWTIGFAIDLPSLGPIHGEIQLRDVRVAVRFWAQCAESVDRIERQFMPLRRIMESNGLQLDQLVCHHGIPQPPSDYSAILLEATA
jgi:hypothetical protein